MSAKSTNPSGGRRGGGGTGECMRQVRARADRRPPRRRVSWAEALALGCAALALGVGAVAWVADPALLTANAPFTSYASFNERFLPPPPAESLAPHYASSVLDRAATATADIRAMQAREMLTRQMQSQDRQAAETDEERDASAAPSVPLPRARPVEANLSGRSVAAAPADTAPQVEQRSMLQKLTDLWPGKITLASLTPSGGLFRTGPDLAALGYDSFTAVYDISARTAPVDSESALGRSGLLVHTYMLGPSGDSNGCVSIRDYERFLKAYQEGEITRLVVVPNLSDSIAASRRSPSPS